MAFINPDAVLRFVCVEVYVNEVRRDSYSRESNFLERVEDDIPRARIGNVDVRG